MNFATFVEAYNEQGMSDDSFILIDPIQLEYIDNINEIFPANIFMPVLTKFNNKHTVDSYLRDLRCNRNIKAKNYYVYVIPIVDSENNMVAVTYKKVNKGVSIDSAIERIVRYITEDHSNVRLCMDAVKEMGQSVNNDYDLLCKAYSDKKKALTDYVTNVYKDDSHNMFVLYMQSDHDHNDINNTLHNLVIKDEYTFNHEIPEFVNDTIKILEEVDYSDDNNYFIASNVRNIFAKYIHSINAYGNVHDYYMIICKFSNKCRLYPMIYTDTEYNIFKSGLLEIIDLQGDLDYTTNELKQVKEHNDSLYSQIENLKTTLHTTTLAVQREVNHTILELTEEVSKANKKIKALKQEKREYKKQEAEAAIARNVKMQEKDIQVAEEKQKNKELQQKIATLEQEKLNLSNMKIKFDKVYSAQSKELKELKKKYDALLKNSNHK